MEDMDVYEDLSYSNLDSFPSFLMERSSEISHLQLTNNNITVLPRSIATFSNLISLDISNNNLQYISGEIARLSKLKTFIARNNNLRDDAVPKEFASMESLRHVNLSGNNLTEFPLHFTNLLGLVYLSLGANRICQLPREIRRLKRCVFQILFLCMHILTRVVGDFMLGTFVLKSVVLNVFFFFFFCFQCLIMCSYYL